MTPCVLLGGTFDPVHDGHLGLADDVRRGLALPEIRLVPAGDPPHRGGPAAPAEDRLAMLRLAVEGRPGLVVDEREVARDGKSYTVLTLKEVRREIGGRPLLLVVGADSFLSLPTWHRWREIFALAHVVVAARPGTVLAPSGDLAAEWTARRVGAPDALSSAPAGTIYEQAIAARPISSTAVREQLARGAAGREAVRQMMPPAVLRYIDQHRLYTGLTTT
jgi:nicotinate-nucleotide adenylyltransferase